MPETMSVERRNLLLAYGAGIVLTDGTKECGGTKKQKKSPAGHRAVYSPGQFDNPGPGNPPPYDRP